MHACSAFDIIQVRTVCSAIVEWYMKKEADNFEWGFSHLFWGKLRILKTNLSAHHTLNNIASGKSYSISSHDFKWCIGSVLYIRQLRYGFKINICISVYHIHK